MLSEREKALILTAWGFADDSHAKVLNHFANCNNEQGKKYYEELVLPFLDEVRAYINSEMFKPTSKTKNKLL